jgi:hypothetical protein
MDAIEQFLGSIPFVRTQISDIVHVRWYYYRPDDCLCVLEYRRGKSLITCSYRDDYIHEVDEYVERIGTSRVPQKINDIKEYIEQNRDAMVASAQNQAKNAECVESISKALGRSRDCAAGTEWGWCVKGREIHIRIFIDWYKNPDTETIRLEVLERTSGWMPFMKTQQQVMCFLEKHADKLKEPLPVDLEAGLKSLSIHGNKENNRNNKNNKNNRNNSNKESNDTGLEASLESLTIEECEPQTRERVASKTKGSMFIPMPKHRRILYQSCRDKEDPWKKLLKSEVE